MINDENLEMGIWVMALYPGIFLAAMKAAAAHECEAKRRERRRVSGELDCHIQCDAWLDLTGGK